MVHILVWVLDQFRDHNQLEYTWEFYIQVSKCKVSYKGKALESQLELDLLKVRRIN